MPFSRRSFLASAAAIPVMHEGLLAAMAAGPVPDTAPRPLVRLSANENPYGPCTGACEAVSRAAPQGARYPYDAIEKLTQRLAKLHGVPSEMIVLGNGSGEILRIAAGAFTGPGRALVTADPTYEAPGRYAQLMSAPVEKVALTAGDFRHDVAKMAVPKAGLIYVCNPNNPTASITPKREIAALVAAIPSGAMLLVDEAYCHFAQSPDFDSALGYVTAGKDVIVARTFSKVYGMAGLRIGYAVARKDVAQQMQRHVLGNNTNALGLEAALASLEDADLVPRNRDRINQTRRLITEWCDRNHVKYAPTQANFVFFHIGRPVGPVITAMRDRGVMVGRPFPPLTDWMRVSVGAPEEVRRFLSEYENLKA